MHLAHETLKTYVIDDDDSVRVSLERLLHSAGMNALLFESAEVFLAFLDSHASTSGDEIAECAIVDVHLPGMNGIELMKHLHTCRPALRVVLITASLDAQHDVIASKEPVILLQKPFDDAALFAAISPPPSAAG